MVCGIEQGQVIVVDPGHRRGTAVGIGNVSPSFEQMDQRFEGIEQRLDRMVGLFLGTVGAFAAIVASTIGFAIWDRRTTLRPVLE